MRDYIYSSGNLLVRPNTYFYTPYVGIKFLKAWKKDRELAYDLLGEQAGPAAMKTDNGIKGVLRKLSGNKAVRTEEILNTLYACLSAADRIDSEKTRQLLDRMVKKFEVTKRIYDSYRGPLRKADTNNYKNLDLYVLLAETLEAAYTRYEDIVYLNALLKLIDTLCSVRSTLNKILKSRLAWLISREYLHVLALADSVKVSL